MVTGGSGFVGLHLLAQLHKLGARVTTLEADIGDKPSVSKAVEQQQVIFHLAAHSGALAGNRFPVKDMEVNCKGLLILLECCRRINPAVRLVFASSRLVYGIPQSLPVDETHPTYPTSIHGIHKLTAENYLRLYNQLYGLPTVSLRITNAYGPHSVSKNRQHGILNIFMQLALRNQAIRIYGDGSQLRDFIYIDDLVEAMLRVAPHPNTYGDLFNVSSGRGISLLEAAETVVVQIGQGHIEHVPWPEEAKKVETGDFVADITKIQRTVGWRPHTEIEAGIRKSACPGLGTTFHQDPIKPY